MQEIVINYKNVIYTILIGSNAQDNWNIISASSIEDIWFHLNDYPSSHIILKNPDNLKINKIPTSIIKRCSILCKEHSKYNNVKNISVIYTQIKNLSKGLAIGSVISHNTKEFIV